MPVDELTTDDTGHPGSLTPFLSVLSVAFLVGIWLWLASSAGGYPAVNWVFPVLALGLFGLAVASTLAIPRRPRRLSLTVLALFGAYSLWVAASNLWTVSSSQALLGSTRTLAYLLVLTLALTYFTCQHARAAFRYLVMLAAFVLLVLLIWRVWSAPHLTALFLGRRLAYPVDQPNSAAALFLVLFWPLMWLAAGPDERAPVRGVALGLATGLLGLAILTQSRGATWSMAVTLVLLFALSPGRLRLLFYLVVPGLLMVYAFPQLNRYWMLGPEAVGGNTAARTLAVAAIAAGFIGMILALLEGWIQVSGRMKVIFGTVVLAACVAGLVYGAVSLTQESGGPVTWFRDAWRQLIAEPMADQQTGSAGVASPEDDPSPSRAEIWRLAWQRLEKAPLLGAGADSPAPDLNRQGSGPLVLQVPGDTGLVGAVLAFGAILVSIVGILWPRLAVGWGQAKRVWRAEGGQGSKTSQGASMSGISSRWGDEPLAYGWQMALFAGAAFWFLEANMESLWPMAGVTVPALLMIAAGLAATDARAASAGSGAAEPRAPSARRFPRGNLRPAGRLSRAFRIALIVLSVTVVILSGSAYLAGML